MPSRELEPSCLCYEVDGRNQERTAASPVLAECLSDLVLPQCLPLAQKNENVLSVLAWRIFENERPSLN